MLLAHSSEALRITEMAEGIDPNWESHLRPQLLQTTQKLRPLSHRLVAKLYSQRLVARLNRQLLITDDEEEKFSKLTKSETDLAFNIRNQEIGSFDKLCEVLLEVGDDSLRDVENLLCSYRTDSLGKKKICTYFLCCAECPDLDNPCIAW